MEYELTNAPVLIFPAFELPFKLYIDAACIQGLGEALHQRQILDCEPRERVICYISRQLKDSQARYGATQTECLCLVWALEKLHYYLEGAGKVHTNADGLSRWPLDNVKSNPAYDPQVAAKAPIHFMEIDRKKNFRFSEWAPESGNTGSEGTEAPILGLGSSGLHNQSFNAVMKTYAKHKQCGIFLQLLQQKYRSPELEFQLEEPWLRDYKENNSFLIDVLL
ncbi:hypothetical protein O181_067685 [Austropuccinia psidii MF-1]|uniref:Reverse transcriptase/retrotransposon-derived protein RNase H-like domain-containing protein n=1 Tax=Austropuccinia psidii MF-1 TaxID=1389203 RepID=A0A9Q3ER81_9BASI|nr:hypothetical protein [Austropuccinia psidii MF-1]